MRAFDYHRPAPARTLWHWYSPLIGVVEERRPTGKTIARIAHADAQSDALAADAVCL